MIKSATWVWYRKDTDVYALKKSTHMAETHGIVGKITRVLEAETGQSSKDSSRYFRKHGLALDHSGSYMSVWGPSHILPEAKSMLPLRVKSRS